MTKRSELGFTLIELSIVLVIIGLIVGGILVGQDLIKASEVRAAVSQIEKYNSSVNTFRSKYNYIPGDIPSSVASNYSFFTETTACCTAGHQDGNWLLEGGAAGAVVQLGEPLGFWRHLTDASLIDGQFGKTTGTALVAASGAAGADITGSTVGQVLPPSKLGRGNYVVVYAFSGANYYQITGVTAITAADGSTTLAKQITPTEAFNIDSKIDDGKPLTGATRAMFHATDLNTLSTAGDTCTNASSVYDTASVNGNLLTCQLRIRFN